MTRARRRRTTTASGRVLREEDGTPIEGVRVRVLSTPHGAVKSIEFADGRRLVATSPPLAETTTDARGRFRLVGVPLSALRGEHPAVEYRHPGRARKVLGLQCSDADAAPPRITVRLARGRRIEGRLRRGRGLAASELLVAGALRLSPHDAGEFHPAALGYSLDEQRGWYRIEAAEHVLVGADGRFTIEGAPAAADVLLGARGTRSRLLVPTVRVAAGAATARVDLTVRPIAPVSVRVTGPDGRPVKGARLDFEGRNRTGADGRAEVVPDWSAGDRGSVTAERNGFADAFALVPLLRRRADPIELKLVPTASLRVRVTDSEGRPVAGTRVRVWPWSAERRGEMSREHRSGADGSFVSRDLPRGEWRVSAQPRGCVFSARIAAVPGGEVSLRTMRAARVRLRLVAPRGRRVPARVGVLAWTAVEWTRAEDTGPGNLSGHPRWVRVVAGVLGVGGLAPFRGHIYLWAPGYDECEVPVDVTEGAFADLGEIRLVVAADPAAATPEWARLLLAPARGRRRNAF